MVYSVKCEGSIKGVIMCSPMLMCMVSLFLCKKGIEQTIVIMIMSIVFSIAILVLILKTKYVLSANHLLIIRAWGGKKIMYEEIDTAKKIEGKISIETPSHEQIWLYKENKVVAKLSPEKIDLFEKNITTEMNLFRKDTVL